MDHGGAQQAELEQRLGAHANSFFSLFGAQVASQWRQRRAAPQAWPSALDHLYPISYFELDARLTAMIRLDPGLLRFIYNAMLTSGAQIRMLQAFTEIPLEEVGFADGIAHQALLNRWARQPQPNYSARREEMAARVARYVARTCWALLHPHRFSAEQRRHLLASTQLMLDALEAAGRLAARSA